MLKFPFLSLRKVVTSPRSESSDEMPQKRIIKSQNIDDTLNSNVLEAIQLATEENFSADGYLLFNLDVRKAGVDPFQHFQNHGKNEKRMQITTHVLPGSSYRKEKFEFFKGVFLDGILEKIKNSNSFPIQLGDQIYSLDDYVAESSNKDFGPFVDECDSNPNKKYLDIGAGLRKHVRRNCLYLEVYPSLTADVIVSPTLPYPIKSESFDGIGCFAVLEHVRRPWELVREMYRMLKPGGKIFIDYPFLQPLHGFPSHYFNATREGLKSIFEDTGFLIETVDTHEEEGPDYTIWWVLGKFINDFPDAKIREKLLNMKVKDLISLSPGGKEWRYYLSKLPDHMISEFSCGNYLIGTKP